MASRVVLAGISGACLLLLLVAAGCGHAKLDTPKLEAQIKTTLYERSGFTIRSVKCPSDVAPKKGATFQCNVTTGGNEHVPVKVTQEDGSGGVRWRLAGPLRP